MFIPPPLSPPPGTGGRRPPPGPDPFGGPQQAPLHPVFDPPPSYAAPGPQPTAYLPPGDRPTRRQGLARVLLLLVVVVAVLLGLVVYLTLDALHLVSFDPLDGLGGWLVLLVLAALGTVALLVFAVIAVAVCRPRLTAWIALVASVLLPAAAVTIAVHFGLVAVSEHARADLGNGATGAATAVSDLLDHWGVDSGPLRDLVKSANGR